MAVASSSGVNDPKPPDPPALERGVLTVEVDPQGLQAAVRFQPDPQGRVFTREALLAALEKKGVKEGVDGKALEQLLRAGQEAEAQGTGGVRTLVVARGRPPEPGEPARLEPLALAIPEAVAGYVEQLAGAQVPPRVFRREVEKVAVEKTIPVKPRFPFLKPREERKKSWRKRETRVGVEVGPGAPSPGPRRVGYARAGDVVAKLSLARRARPGRSVLGREISPPSQEAGQLLLGEHLSEQLSEHGTEIRAAAAGFVRWGTDWIELVPFEVHEFAVRAEGRECLLDFRPGSDAASPPTADEVRAAALQLGFPEEDLLSEEELALLLSRSLTDETPLERVSLCRPRDAQIRVEVSEDRLRASLTLIKGRGGGRALVPAEVAEEIRRHKLKGMDTERVRRDLLEFTRSERQSLEDYLLVEGRAPQAGEDGRIEWRLEFLAESKAADIREKCRSRAERLQGPAAVASLSEFPLDAVERVARVGQGAAVARLHPAGPGQPGVDVFGTGLPGPKGREPALRTFENLLSTKGELTSQAAGLLERGAREETLLLRVRPHQDAEARVRLSEDRMQAFLTLLPSAGTGLPLTAELVEAAIEEAGVRQGIDREAVAAAIAKQSVEDCLVAEGQPAEPGRDTELEVLARRASGQAVSLTGDGRADFKRQDRITAVASGTLLARLPAPTAGRDGWDVTGKTIAARKGAARFVHVGKNVDSRVGPQGETSYYARIEGELHCDAGSLDVLRVHTVGGDVGLATGNVKFSGTIRIEGSVGSGFSVIGEESVLVEGGVQGALVSAGESIQIGKGIVGEGKAVLRARKTIRAHFAEQATLLAVEDIRLTNACLRCRVKCNGKVVLASEKGNLIGGGLQAKLGLQAASIGSEREVRTEISFGQDVLVGDQLEREERASAKLRARNLEIDAALRRLERGPTAAANELGRLRAEKVANLKTIELHAKRVFILQERFEQHFPSEVVVRGVVHPGVVLRSHGRSREIKVALREVVFYFDTATGRIEERALTG